MYSEKIAVNREGVQICTKKKSSGFTVLTVPMATATSATMTDSNLTTPILLEAHTESNLVDARNPNPPWWETI